MTSEKLNLRKKIGLVLLAAVLAYWIAVPIIPFLDLPYKVVIIPTLIVIGEGLTVVAIAILGKEYWEQIKASVRRFFQLRREDSSKIEDE